jgi:flavin reductase (DIM6/NTAB) family NADH-FMN oxidoreductase RutF
MAPEMNDSEKQMKIVSGRDVAAILNPRLAVLVTCRGLAGQANLLTVAWHTPLSHSPPYLGIAISPDRYSHQLIEESNEFVINLLGQSMKNKAELCGNLSGLQEDKFDSAKLKTRPAKLVLSPVLTDALGHIECVLHDRKTIGDHSLFIGQIVHAQVRKELFSNAWEASSSIDSPLLCLQRQRYASFME